jgi:hypothetical protein
MGWWNTHAQIWLYGSSFESCLVAVVVPDKHKLLQWAASAGPGLAGMLL